MALWEEQKPAFKYPQECPGCGTPLDVSKMQSNTFGLRYILCDCGRTISYDFEPSKHFKHHGDKRGGT